MIKFQDLHKINARFEDEFKERFQHFLNSGHYILGNEVSTFENNYAKYCGTKYCVGVSNGLDALILIFKGYIELGLLKKGDEVLVPANTYIASIQSVILAGLTPVFIEPNEDTLNISVLEIEKYITPKVKAVLAVHLYGQLADMETIQHIATTHELIVVEDAAQAHGAISSNELKAGNLSDAAAFSFYPSKNLGALGDAGAITTANEPLANIIRELRNYGSSEKYVNNLLGFNNRLDEVQAMFLNIKLKLLDADNQKRRVIANQYLSEINNDKIKLPYYNQSKNHVFHQFVILVPLRDEFINYLKSHQVETLIHYPIAPHKQKALSDFETLKLPVTEYIHETIVSLPISPVMSEDEVRQIIHLVNSF